MPKPEEIEYDEDSDEESEEDTAALEAAAKKAEERQKKMQNLRARMNQARNLNTEAANDEFRRKTEGDAEVDKREKREEHAKRKRKHEQDIAEGIAEETNGDLAVTASAASEMQKKKRKKDKNAASFGWDMFNVDTQVKTYKKRVQQVHDSFGDELQEKYQKDKEMFASNPQKLEDLQYNVVDQPTNEMRFRLQKELTVQQAKRGQFSRRRAHNDETDVDYINDRYDFVCFVTSHIHNPLCFVSTKPSHRNQVFNEKLKRSFDGFEHTTAIRQNLERGTAL